MVWKLTSRYFMGQTQCHDTTIARSLHDHPIFSIDGGKWGILNKKGCLQCYPECFCDFPKMQLSYGLTLSLSFSLSHLPNIQQLPR